MRLSRGILRDLLAPLALLLTLIVLFAVTGIDLLLERYFYHPGFGWIYADLSPRNVLYEFGFIPSVASSVGSLLLVIASSFPPAPTSTENAPCSSSCSCCLARASREYRLKAH